MAVDGREGNRAGTAEHTESEGESVLERCQTRGTPCLNAAVCPPRPFYVYAQMGQRATTQWTSTDTRTRITKDRKSVETRDRARETMAAADNLW